MICNRILHENILCVVFLEFIFLQLKYFCKIIIDAFHCFRASNVSGERSPFDGSCCGSGYHTVDSTPLGSPEEVEIPKYRVVLLGDAGVGKTALVSQFMTSEYMNTYDASLGKNIFMDI